MILSTAKKVRFLQEYISEWAEKLIAPHRENISGIRIDKKFIKGNKQIQYAIVFQVVNKLNKIELKEGQIIPDYFNIFFPDGIERRIKTDIHQTGEFRFQSFIGSEIESAHSYEFGSMGLFVNDFFNNSYAVTNYHVAAKTLMNQGVFLYRNDNNTLDVSIKDSDGSTLNGSFAIGRLNNDVDIAFISVAKTSNIVNRLPNGNLVNIPWGKEKTLNASGKLITIYSFYNDGVSTTIKDTSMSINNPSCNITINNLIQLKGVVTQPGDSGGLVVDHINSVVGIVVGADDYSSYIIPFYKIFEYLKCYPI
ncbi:serine protease [Flavobacterium pectinovorum]|uniref:serine protease n=1 Tax=Flavobacterium pectinovorum TaxID=29533 RepID=UPI001FAC7BB6|nr:serine protease [Flavobacterium pectinovorum]MCI9843624.1 hypothetical protein [Flavobacterium pectinovorum]